VTNAEVGFTTHGNAQSKKNIQKTSVQYVT
jgi:hypothetical protein